jgi:hypothetical protein
VKCRSKVSAFLESGVWGNQLPRSRETQNPDKVLIFDRGASLIVGFLGKHRHFGSHRFEGENHPKVSSCEVLTSRRKRSGPWNLGSSGVVDLGEGNFRGSGIGYSKDKRWS